MSTKRYRLSQQARQFNNKGEFGFRIRFGVPLGDGRTRVCAKHRCPVIRVPYGGVFQITNEVGQFFVEHFIVPNKTLRNRKAREPGPIFEDVTDETTDYDVDFESLMAVQP